MIAVPDSNAGKRLDLTSRIRRFCDEHGFGLWVADVRSGFRSGSWFPIVRPGATSTFEAADSTTDWAACAEWSLPVTFVGPARTHAVRAIVGYLAAYPEIKMWACSMSVVDDVAFVHTQLTSVAASVGSVEILNGRIDRHLTLEGQTTELHGADPATELPLLIATLGATPLSAPEQPGPESRLGHIAGFHVLMGPAKPIDPNTGVKSHSALGLLGD